MFESFLQRILAAIGAGDQLIAVMGPTFTILLAWLAGGMVAQFLKYPLERHVKDPTFSFVVRLIAISSTIAFAHYLSDTIPATLEVVVGVVQPLAYHLSLAAIRRWWPWLETRKYVGSATPPASAFVAEAQRAADKL